MVNRLFSGINVSQDSVATNVPWDGSHDNRYTASLPENLNSEITLKIGYDLTKLWPWVGVQFLAHPVLLYNFASNNGMQR